MFDSPAIRDELARIREGFLSARLAGLWHSRYPQSQWSELLGCDVREQVMDDPACSIVLRRPTHSARHAVGSAIPTPGSVWCR